tara:strand:+ start:4464 stop:5258 length:795 start_codon:yes stop_codon:yes gene_type:complete
MEIIWQAIILGIIQGLTEFLPVSSSGHLELAKCILGDESMPKESLLMTVVLHAATALSTVVVFWREIKEIFAGLLQFSWNKQFKFSLKIILSMIPAALAGIFFDEQIDALFGGQILLVGSMLFITGLLLFLADKAQKTEKDTSFGHALLIGLAQAIAILPGISRSGATISTSVLLGIDRERAARFSFLMVVPLIFGKMADDVLGGRISMDTATILPLSIGFISAFVTGLVACKWMVKLVKQSQLKYFAYYCFVVGTITVFWNWL